MFINRNYREIKTFIESGHSVMVFGPRGSGKTSFLEQIIKAKDSFRIVDLLDLKTFLKYSRDPSLFAAEIEKECISSDTRFPRYYLIDEIQKLPELLDEVQKLLVQNTAGKLVFILTGSSARKLKTKEANLLAGRALSCFFYPFSSD
ncbi:MAG: AAA family ATPase, partial [Bdellovibrionales bacterium]|nr:AAA family ATPase [Bdellovibrionales bacterium]